MSTYKIGTQPAVEHADPLWHELLIEAKSKPWLLQQLGEHGATLYLRFRAGYRRLQELRPAQLRRLQRKLGVGLAGAALLLALSGGPVAGAPVGNISVDGTVCTLADAITTANSGTDTGGCTDGSAGADTLTLTNNIGLTAVLPDIASDITIEGGGRSISGDDTFRIFRVNASGSLTLNSITVSGGSANFGGGIYNNGGSLSINNSTITGNSAGNSGAGLAVRSGSATISGSTISSNTASDKGGGIYVPFEGTVMLTNSTVSGNSAADGGGIYNTSDGGPSLLTLSGSTVSANTATTKGGGIYNDETTSIISGSMITGNSSRKGVGVFNGGTLTVSASTISSNTTTNNGSGGGLFNNYGAVDIVSSTISGNVVVNGSGGGLYNHKGTISITTSTIRTNQAGNAAGISNREGDLIVTYSTISGNSASNNGGGLNMYGNTVTMINSTISGNTADTGGGIRNATEGATSVLNLTHVTIANNSAVSGGGIYNGVTANLKATIVGRQQGGGDCDGSVTSLGYNLESGTSCGFTGTGDLQDTDPLLKTLENNGGSTQTHALQSDLALAANAVLAPTDTSPALDKVPTPCAVSFDQRKETRPAIGSPGGANYCDIGAFEHRAGGTSNAVDLSDMDARQQQAWPGAVLTAVLGIFGLSYAGRRRLFRR